MYESVVLFAPRCEGYLSHYGEGETRPALTHPPSPRMMSGPMSFSRNRSAAVAKDAPPVPAPLPAFELQELWFATLRAEWASLAVIPAHAGGSAFEIARALAEAGSRHRGTPVRLVKADANDLAQTAQFVDSLSRKSGGGSTKRGGEIIIAVDPVVENPLGIAIAFAADAVLVTIELGVTDLASARKTIEMVGRERLLGCVVVDPAR